MSSGRGVVAEQTANPAYFCCCAVRRRLSGPKFSKLVCHLGGWGALYAWVALLRSDDDADDARREGQQRRGTGQCPCLDKASDGYCPRLPLHCAAMGCGPCVFQVSFCFFFLFELFCLLGYVPLSRLLPNAI